MRIELHPSEGGADAATFTGELAGALARAYQATVTASGRVTVVDGPDCL